MADYGVGISLSQAHTSDGDSSEHSPRSAPTLSACGGGDGGSKSKTPCNKIITLDQCHQTPSSSENTVRKPRGRPPGSKNKPKPPIVITRDSNSTMKPVILEISPGSDIIDAIIGFARTNSVGVSIISVTGSVSNVTLRHPVPHAAALSLHGPFGLLSLSGSFIARTSQSFSSSTTKPPSPFGVTLAGAQGQVFGGVVGGKVTAATQVIVVAATFTEPEHHLLPCEGDDKDHHHHQETKSGAATESVYGVASPTPLNCQMPPDVMPWGPSCRPY
ncbi:Calcium-dependent lipid-binding family protein [Hibiscus syriacus]|uniref:Calcium-dependent lipid-binding family protein n=1 Tax=Hibiscus syriacus TaxID=106335 RepID=A0A6A2XYE1_HIBSY|nr:AT-hook motif nuclear-localized protein 28-like [Hibiscus syriacus]KAE8663789.1 Calcium-dependent lipid-binding family protein [Hibiscus syriacus]